jgi:hypothetical protein
VKDLLPKAVVILVLVTGLTGCTQAFQDLQNQGPRGPGSNYEAYLTGQRYLVDELDHSPGAKWDESRPASADFRKQLERITNKNVEIRTNAELPAKGEEYAWSDSELRDLHDQHEDLQENDNRVVMHALFLEGKHQRERTAGLAYEAEAFALFMDKLEEVTCQNGAGITCPDRAERYEVVRAVSIHEAGHLLGLVNAPLPMVNDHEDADHEAHSTNEESVMFWKVESARAITDLFGGDTVPYKFDSNDMADANAQRSGGSS